MLCQNGWPVVYDRSRLDTADLYPGISVPNGVLAGDVAVVFRWLARRYHLTVEALVPGTCWGWYVKQIEGSSTYSNHAGGLAVDFNAPQHPMGTPASRNMSALEIDACHAIVRAAGGVLRWGGDYVSRPDPMHWEIVGTPAQVGTLAAKIRGDVTPAPATPSRTERIVQDLPLVNYGDSGLKVKRVQALANQYPDTGTDVYVDGDFGDATRAKVKRVQSKAGVTADGEVGPVTWAVLLGVH